MIKSPPPASYAAASFDAWSLLAESRVQIARAMEVWRKDMAIYVYDIYLCVSLNFVPWELPMDPPTFRFRQWMQANGPLACVASLSPPPSSLPPFPGSEKEKGNQFKSADACPIPLAGNRTSFSERK